MKSVEYYQGDQGATWDWGYRGPGWYFWDETWSWAFGPFETELLAREKLREYVATL